MVKNGEQVEAHMWSSSTQSWTNVGTVVDAVGSNRKKEYQGKEYDFVFDVDIQEGMPPLKLPYNASENPFDAARKFLEDNELPMSYLDTVGKFIVENTKGVTVGPQDTSDTYDPWGTGSTSYKDNAPKPRLLPHREYLDISTANLTVVEKKLNEFNQALIDAGEKGVSLNPTELEALSAFVNALRPSTKEKPAAALSAGLDILVKIITSWPANKRLPALDLLRLLAGASPLLAETKINGQDLVGFLKGSGAVSKDLPNNAMLGVRAFANLFKTEAGRKYASANYEQILGFVKDIGTGTTNRNLKLAEATLLLK